MAEISKGEMQDFEELQDIYMSNMDEAPARRRAREAFKHIQLAIDHCLFRVMDPFSQHIQLAIDHCLFIFLLNFFSLFSENTYFNNNKTRVKNKTFKINN